MATLILFLRALTGSHPMSMSDVMELLTKYSNLHLSEDLAYEAPLAYEARSTTYRFYCSYNIRAQITLRLSAVLHNRMSGKSPVVLIVASFIARISLHPKKAHLSLDS